LTKPRRCVKLSVLAEKIPHISFPESDHSNVMFALNFYTDLYEEILRSGRKSATIRLGDKSDKYQTGQLVWVTVGQKYGRRQKLFTAIIDSVDVKLLSELSPRDISKENPEFRTIDEVVHFLQRLYGPEISLDDTVTIIYFSPVSEY
jgi:hypothetical protein